MSTEPDILVEVRFEVTLNSDEMPPTYRDPEYLEEVIQEALNDAMYDIGAEEVKEVRIEIEGLE